MSTWMFFAVHIPETLDVVPVRNIDLVKVEMRQQILCHLFQRLPDIGHYALFDPAVFSESII